MIKAEWTNADALNLQPTCNQLATDCISRQAAIKAIEDLQDCYNGFSDTYDKACIIGVLEELPAVQTERKTGKWVRHGIGHENVPWGFDCSACGEWFVIGDDTAERYNFCPNCGAKMNKL